MDIEQKVEGETVTTTETITQEPSQETSAVEKELNEVTGKSKYTPEEKAAFNLKKNAELAESLGINVEEVIGLKKPEANSDIPEWYRKLEAEKAQKTALELADDIENEHERALVKHALENVITGGSPTERLRVARGYVNSVKNGQVAEELARKGTPSSGSSAGAPAPKKPTEIELTPQEEPFTKPPFNMTKAEIISKRPQN